jgi:hypothetical protein
MMHAKNALIKPMPCPLLQFITACEGIRGQLLTLPLRLTSVRYMSCLEIQNTLRIEFVGIFLEFTTKSNLSEIHAGRGFGRNQLEFCF